MENSKCGLVYKTNGDIRKLFPEDGKTFSARQLREVVGGCFEIHSLKNGCWLVCHGEGALIPLPFNIAGTILYGYAVFGDILVCPMDMID